MKKKSKTLKKKENHQFINY